MKSNELLSSLNQSTISRILLCTTLDYPDISIVEFLDEIMQAKLDIKKDKKVCLAVVAFLKFIVYFIAHEQRGKMLKSYLYGIRAIFCYYSVLVYV